LIVSGNTEIPLLGAAWWGGIFIGLGLGLTALIFRDHGTMRKAIQNAIIATFCFTVARGVLGFFYGRFILTKTGVDWWLPGNLVDRMPSSLLVPFTILVTWADYLDLLQASIT